MGHNPLTTVDVTNTPYTVGIQKRHWGYVIKTWSLMVVILSVIERSCLCYFKSSNHVCRWDYVPFPTRRHSVLLQLRTFLRFYVLSPSIKVNINPSTKVNKDLWVHIGKERVTNLQVEKEKKVFGFVRKKP